MPKLILGARPTVRKALPNEACLFASDMLVERKVSSAGTFAQMHQRTVSDNRGQPGRHLRLPPELADMPVSGQQSFLHGILRVGCIAQKPQSAPIKGRQAE